MGGTDDPSNLIQLTVEEHAEAHRKLYEEHGNEYDRIAWQCLSGQINSMEATIQATKLANTGREPWNKGKKVPQCGSPGRKVSEETKQFISERTKQKMKERGVTGGVPKGTVPWNKGKKLSAETIAKRTATRKANRSN
jgi:hypothetical protein